MFLAPIEFYIIEFQRDLVYIPRYYETKRINLDHQHTIFNENNKTFAWKGSLPNCNNYQITSTTCDGMRVRQWQGTVNQNTITVPTKYLVHDNNSQPLLLKLDSLDGEGNICQEATQYIEVDEFGMMSRIN